MTSARVAPMRVANSHSSIPSRDSFRALLIPRSLFPAHVSCGNLKGTGCKRLAVGELFH